MRWRWRTTSEQSGSNSPRPGLGGAGRRAQFGPFLLDALTEELWKDGVRVRLQSQPFRILVLLVSNPNELITRETIRAAIWPEESAVGFDNSINASMNKLRRAIEDSALAPRYIETLARRGYRFTGSVEWLDRGEPAKASKLPSVWTRLKEMAIHRKRQVIMTSLMLGLLALLLVVDVRLAF
jgi:DNA-binding winged helix-turn-helix (wHTH) protein